MSILNITVNNQRADCKQHIQGPPGKRKFGRKTIILTILQRRI